MVKSMIYLDNAASSFPKPESVAAAVSNALRRNGANPGRSGHFLSEKAAADIYEVREAFGRHYSCAPENVVFTLNATMALNYVIQGLIRKGDHVLISDLEHNSVLRPVAALAEKGICEYDVVETAKDPAITLQAVKKKLKLHTKAVIFTHASNVTGQILPVDEIGEFCRGNGILFIVDASQASGLFVPRNADVVCTAGHKGFYGPQGTGLFAVLNDALCDAFSPFIQGGTGTDSMSFSQPDLFPEGFEAGTLNTPGILGLYEGLKFVESKRELYYRRERELHGYLLKELRKVPGIELYSEYENSVPTIAFNLNGMISEKVTELLNAEKICVRGGYHCAALCHNKLKTAGRGAVRVSLGAFNTEDDAVRFIKAVFKI